MTVGRSRVGLLFDDVANGFICRQFHKYFTTVAYSGYKISWHVLKHNLTLEICSFAEAATMVSVVTGTTAAATVTWSANITGATATTSLAAVVAVTAATLGAKGAYPSEVPFRYSTLE